MGLDISLVATPPIIRCLLVASRDSKHLCASVNVYYHHIYSPNMSENHLEDYMAGYMNEDDVIYDAQPQPEIHKPDEPAASEPYHPDIPPPTRSSHR